MQKITLFFCLVLFLSTTVFAQWTKQNLPATDAMSHMQVDGGSIGKDIFWMHTIAVGLDTTKVSKYQVVRSTDGGQTWQVSDILPDVATNWAALHPVSATQAFISLNDLATGAASIMRTTDGGATWQTLDYHPPTFLNATLFSDDNNGFIICDPDADGAFIAHTTDGGQTWTRTPNGTYPPMNSGEFFNGGLQRVFGNTILQPTVNIETGEESMWRSTDQGKTWTAGAHYLSNNFFGTMGIFSDGLHGLQVRGVESASGPETFETHDGGVTWHANGGKMPGRLTGGYFSSLPNTHTIMAIFEDLEKNILFSAITNDFGKTWNSRKDLVPYTLDPVYTDLGKEPFAWTNLEIVDNNTAWAKFSRTELYRYENATPLVPEQPDLDLEMVADNEDLPLYGSVKYTLKVKNRGITAATGVRIHWLPPYKRTDPGVEPYAFQAGYANGGRLDPWNGIWTIERIEPGGEATATYHLFVLQNKQSVVQTAQVVACNEQDLDSKPNNLAGTAKEDDEVSFTAKGSLSFKANDRGNMSKRDFAVTPNPAKDHFMVTINPVGNAEWSVRVLNTIGQTVFSQKGQSGSSLKIDAQTFESGLYIVEYQYEQEMQVEKVLVER